VRVDISAIVVARAVRVDISAMVVARAVRVNISAMVVARAVRVNMFCNGPRLGCLRMVGCSQATNL
jgi:hypothetical protein